MLVHLAGALAVGALRVGRMQAMGANRVLEVELAHVGMDDQETLIDQQRAKRKPDPVQGPKFLIAAGKASNVGAPSARRR
jgi:hypothetical protein